MKLTTLLISARAYGVTTLIELACLEQLAKPEHQTGVSLKTLSNLLGDSFESVVAASARLEEIQLVEVRRTNGRTILQSMRLQLSIKGGFLMFGKDYRRPQPNLDLATI